LRPPGRRRGARPASRRRPGPHGAVACRQGRLPLA
jgi:hypothetical protein